MASKSMLVAGIYASVVWLSLLCGAEQVPQRDLRVVMRFVDEVTNRAPTETLFGKLFWKSSRPGPNRHRHAACCGIDVPIHLDQPYAELILTLPAEESWAVKFDDSATKYTIVSGPEAPDTQVITIPVRLPIKVTGRMVTPDGHPWKDDLDIPDVDITLVPHVERRPSDDDMLYAPPPQPDAFGESSWSERPSDTILLDGPRFPGTYDLEVTQLQSVTVRRTVQLPKDADLGDIVLHPCRAIAVDLVTEDGRPVPDAYVYFDHPDLEDPERDDYIHLSVERTNAQGRTVLYAPDLGPDLPQMIPSGRWKARMTDQQVVEKGLALVGNGEVTFDDSTKQVRLLCRKAPRVTVRAQSADGVSCAGRIIQIMRSFTASSSEEPFQIVLDGNGSGSTVVAPGTYGIGERHNKQAVEQIVGWADLSIDVWLPAATKAPSVPVPIEATPRIAGTLTVGGNPIADDWYLSICRPGSWHDEVASILPSAGRFAYAQSVPPVKVPLVARVSNAYSGRATEVGWAWPMVISTPADWLAWNIDLPPQQQAKVRLLGTTPAGAALVAQQALASLLVIEVKTGFPVGELLKISRERDEADPDFPRTAKEPVTWPAASTELTLNIPPGHYALVWAGMTDAELAELERQSENPDLPLTMVVAGRLLKSFVVPAAGVVECALLPDAPVMPIDQLLVELRQRP